MDADGVNHKATCDDWETAATYYRREKSFGSEGTLADIEKTFVIDYPARGMAFAKGTHSRRPEQWLLVGVLRLDLVRQPSLAFETSSASHRLGATWRYLMKGRQDKPVISSRARPSVAYCASSLSTKIVTNKRLLTTENQVHHTPLMQLPRHRDQLQHPIPQHQHWVGGSIDLLPCQERRVSSVKVVKPGRRSRPARPW